MTFPNTDKKLKSRISSYKSALNKEKKIYRYINDGAGKRYLLFALYFVLNDLKKSEKYFKWYKAEFDDDAGEPIQKLCQAVSLFRMDYKKDAKYMLADLMLTNLYIIPQVLEQNIKEYNIWHSSSDEYIDYFDDIPEEVLRALTIEDKNWIKKLYGSFTFQRIRQKHIDIYRKLLTDNDFESRNELCDEADTLLDQLK